MEQKIAQIALRVNTVLLALKQSSRPTSMRATAKLWFQIVASHEMQPRQSSRTRTVELAAGEVSRSLFMGEPPSVAALRGHAKEMKEFDAPQRPLHEITNRCGLDATKKAWAKVLRRWVLRERIHTERRSKT
ncbi:hypothetical protein [Arthrobacter sp. H35-D1]|uniref:hypothetical protein n=1 Tax=Arthrobacter sp. H35-D1 TaxID=3046202 RepID=UPI0024B9512F|nr:hypothetical protein [Arthrobacter sp. H35-D1]MDJ0312285.1 hypothetical protein [Arthrobacter sp. H35-D1]